MADWIELLLRVVLAGTFAAAALSKLADRNGTAAAAQALGVPGVAARLVGPALPLVEGALAAVLVSSMARLGAGLAVLVMAAFTVVLALNIARDNRPACNCFGAASSEPISERTLIRNLVLTAAAAVLVLALPDSVPSLWSVLDDARRSTSAQGAVLLALVAVVAGQTVALFRLAGRTPTAPPAPAGDAAEPAGLPVGALAPGFEIPRLGDGTLTSAELLERGRPVLLVFVDPGCEPCGALLPEVEDWQRSYADELTTVLVSRGSTEANERKLAGLDLTDVGIQRRSEVAAAFRSEATPSAVLLDADGHVSAGAAVGAHEIRHLVSGFAAATAAPLPDPPLIGDPAPLFELPNTAGGTTSLHEHHQRVRLVVFWSPTCTFCRELHHDLVEWERSLPAEGAPALLVVSSGSVRANAGEGFVAPVLLDDSGATMRAYGIGGTPSAVLIDAAGRIASDPATGGIEVLALSAKAVLLSAVAHRLQRSAERGRPPVLPT